jgi:hypothetical protein
MVKDIIKLRFYFSIDSIIDIKNKKFFFIEIKLKSYFLEDF